MAIHRPTSSARTAVRLLACDIDGTILDADGALRPSVRRAVRAIGRSGVHVVLATGRSPWSGVADVADALGLTGPQVTMQGALVSDPRTREVYRAAGLGRSLYLDTLRFARDHWVDPLVGCLEGHRFERVPHWLRFAGSQLTEGLHARRAGSLAELAGADPIRVYLPTGPQRHRAIRLAAIERFGDRASVVWGDESGVEILAPGTNKATGVAWLAAQLGIAMDAVAAVGDATNDTELLQLAGRSAAMGTAPASVRAAADIVVPPADDAGVLDAFAWFFPDVALGFGAPPRRAPLRPRAGT